MPNRVVHFEIMGGGPGTPGLLQILVRLAGQRQRSNSQLHTVLPVPAPDGGIGGGIGAADGTTFITVYVEVDNLDATCETAETLGAELVLRRPPSPRSTTYGSPGCGTPTATSWVWSSGADSLLPAPRRLPASSDRSVDSHPLVVLTSR